MKLSGKVAVVTGAARGIGQAAALELAREGADVMASDILPAESARATLEQIEALGRRAIFHQGDVGDRAADEQMIRAAIEQLGRIDILVNNAAFSIRKPFLDLEPAEVEKVWAADVWGVFHCSQFAAREMVRRGEGGSIVIVSSVLSSIPLPDSTAYNAAKAAVNQMARTWALELAPHGIRVNAVEPGWTDTPGERSYLSEAQIREEGGKLLMGRLARPAEIAKAIVFLASGDASYITGSILRADGGFALNH